jgi:segregation and condensation protein B
MMDENKDTLNEESQEAMAQADVPPADDETTQDAFDNEEEPAPSRVEPSGDTQEPVQEQDQASMEGELVLDQAQASAEDTEAVESTAEDRSADLDAQAAQERQEQEDATQSAADQSDAAEEESSTADEGVESSSSDVGELAEQATELAGEVAQTTEEIVQTVEKTETLAQAAENADQAPELSGPDSPQSETPTVESVIEAILFATDEPLTDGKLASIVETTAKQVRESVDNLNTKYAANHSAFRVEQIAGGYQMLTLNLYNPWLKKMLRARSDNKLSPAAMETLAIIAYKQPIIRADIESIRGVAVGEVIRSLMYKGLVKIAGRAEILGRPMLYGTTKKFLEIFGLNSLKDLPKAEELKNPDRQ